MPKDPKNTISYYCERNSTKLRDGLCLTTEKKDNLLTSQEKAVMTYGPDSNKK